jgi:hypothetical protein
LAHLAIALFVYQLSALLYGFAKRHAYDNPEVCILWGILFFSVIPIAGSDTGVSKIAALFFMPVLILRYWRDFNIGLRWATVAVVMALLMCMPIQRLKLQYEDRSIARTLSVISHPYLKGVHTSALRKEFVESMMREVSALQGPYVFVGKVRHLFDYLFNQSGGYSSNFWSNLENADYISDLERHIDSHPIEAIFIVSHYPEEKPQAKDSALEGMLRRCQYHCDKDTGLYKMYQRLRP